MSIAFVAPGVAMRTAPGGLALWRPLAAAAPPPADTLTAISGLEAWWDAAQPTTMQDEAGVALSGWNQPVGALTDRSGAGNALLPWRAGTGSAPPLATPRLSALLGGAGRVAGGTGTLAPALDADLGWRGPSLNWGTGWTRVLVWSRPNRRQNSGHDAAPSALLTAGSAVVLSQDGTALKLFGTTLKNDLARRHTHSVVLRHTPGSGIDAWVDGAQAATGIASPLTGAAAITLLHDATMNGAAQCWLHEAASWNRALAGGEITSLLACLTRWTRGPRKGLSILVIGQSNAVNYALNDGAAALLAQGTAWHLGALAANVIASTGGAAYTMASGHGIYALGASLPGSFVQDPGTGADPATWALGADGNAVSATLAAIPAEDAADIAAIFWPWNETDSLRAYADKATFKAAAKRFLSLQRAMLGRTAAQLPLLWWNAIPYGAAAGIQMHREVVAELAADPAQNVVIVNPMTADSIARGATWNPATGIATGGDSAHRDSGDNQRFARLAAPIAARALLAAGRADTLAEVPAGIAAQGGPRIVAAQRESATSILLTIAHDAGDDLLVPLQAANGAGFAVMDGGAVGAAGTIRNASACARVDATHLRLTLSSALTNPGGLLFYPYGGTGIGRGNAVTDNAATRAKPAFWDIAADLGSAWSLNFPLQATAAPIALST